MGKDSISSTEKVFCSSIIDLIWFVLTVLLTWMDSVYNVYTHVFNVLYESEKTCFYVFFICKLMFLTSMLRIAFEIFHEIFQFFKVFLK